MLTVIQGRGTAAADTQYPRWLLPPTDVATPSAPSLQAAPLSPETAARLSQVYGLNRALVNERCPRVLRQVVASHLLRWHAMRGEVACTTTSCPKRWDWIMSERAAQNVVA